MADNGLQNAAAFCSNRQLQDEALAALQNASSRAEFSRQLKLKDRYLIENRIVAVAFEHPGGGKSVSQVMMVNFAADGAGMITSGYIHPSTMATLLLPNHAGVPTPISGNVTFCDYLVKTLHAINIQWQQPIDPFDFVDQSKLDGDLPDGADQQNPQIQGRMLYLNEDRTQSQQIRAMLTGSKIEFVWSADVDAALGELRGGPFDVVFVDTANPLSAALDEIIRIRSEAHPGPILIGEQEGNQTHIKELRRLGYRYFVQKPIKRGQLFSTLSNAIETSAAENAPASSHGQRNRQTSDANAQYLDIIAMQISKLRQAIKEDDCTTALKVCHTLRATGCSYGFPMVSETASDAFTALSASCSPRQSIADLERVIAVVQGLAA